VLFCANSVCAFGKNVAADPVRAAAAEAMEALGLQPSLPHDPVEVPDQSRWHLDLPDWVIWTLAVVGVGVLLYALRDFFPGFVSATDEGWADGADSRFGASGRAQPNELDEADRLAGQGLFVEAMHQVLLHCLNEIRRRQGNDFPDSLTSREILRVASLPEHGRQTLNWIVAKVEWSYFGDHPAARPDYESCRAGAAVLDRVLADAQTA
jgi:hypothetical protein